MKKFLPSATDTAFDRAANIAMHGHDGTGEDSLSKIASKSLGDSTSYAVTTDKFDASLLNPMPRAVAREGYGITGAEFGGKDLWTCHEATFLLDNGFPVAGTLRFSYDASSKFMIESKSAKLYLNSFDMCMMGKTFGNACKNYEFQIRSDLSKVLETTVDVTFFLPKEYKDGYKNATDLLKDSVDLIGAERSDDGWYGSVAGAVGGQYVETMLIDDYKGEKNHIEVVETGKFNNYSYHTNILRSRCRHTKQKDTGTALISYGSTKFIAPPSLLKQVISLREVNEFHEFCAEKLYIEIASKLNFGDRLNVTLLYSRRGSLDINPARYNSNYKVEQYSPYYGTKNIFLKTQGQ